MRIIKKLCLKILTSCLIAFTFIASYQIVVNASTSSVTLDNWYADLRIVGYWEDQPSIYVTNVQTTFNVVPYVSNAVSKWKNAGISSIVTTTPSNADVMFYGGSRSLLNAVGFVYTSQIYGQERWESSTYVSEAKTSTSTFGIYKVTSAIASMCSEVESELGTSYYNQIALHELGHVLGWYGHATTTDAVMYSYPESAAFSLTSTDITHLKQIYDAMT